MPQIMRNEKESNLHGNNLDDLDRIIINDYMSNERNCFNSNISLVICPPLTCRLTII